VGQAHAGRFGEEEEGVAGEGLGEEVFPEGGEAVDAAGQFLAVQHQALRLSGGVEDDAQDHAVPLFGQAVDLGLFREGVYADAVAGGDGHRVIS
jgi:hypothetical protein